jgi:hypothetical protein
MSTYEVSHGLRHQSQREHTQRRCRRRHSTLVGIARRIRHDGHQVRLREGALRCLHRACRRCRHPLLQMFNNGLDPDTTDGAINLAYALPNMRVEYLRVEPPGIPTAFWRSVGPSHNVFVTESFMDELAAAAKQDPVTAPKPSSSLLRKRPAGDSPCLTGWAVASPSISPSRSIWHRLSKLKCRRICAVQKFYFDDPWHVAASRLLHRRRQR